MRRFRKLIDVSIPIIGAVVVFLAVLLIPDFNLQERLVTVLIGILMIEAGVWKLTSPFLPSERRFVELRKEVDGFILLVRDLNEAGLEARASDTSGSWLRVRGVMDAMHGSVEHMGELAGKAAGEDPRVVPSPGKS